jgi:hypothetical protein
VTFDGEDSFCHQQARATLRRLCAELSAYTGQELDVEFLRRAWRPIDTRATGADRYPYGDRFRSYRVLSGQLEIAAAAISDAIEHECPEALGTVDVVRRRHLRRLGLPVDGTFDDRGRPARHEG